MTVRGASTYSEYGVDSSFAEFGTSKQSKGGKKDRKNSKEVLRSGSIMSDYPSLNIQRVLETEEHKGNRRNTSNKEALSDPNLVSTIIRLDHPSYNGFLSTGMGIRTFARLGKRRLDLQGLDQAAN